MSIPLAIYYATMTGNAESLARRASARALSEGWQTTLLDLAEVDPADLLEGRLALFIVSTWGDGEPPDEAFDFWHDLGKANLDFGALRYAVLGLGDSDYADFNAFARNLDERLAGLGGARLAPRVDADLDFDDTYAAWEANVFDLLAKLRTEHQPAAS